MARAALVILPLLALAVFSGPCQAFNLKGLIDEDWMLWGLKYGKWLMPEANTLAELAQQAPGNMSMLMNAIPRADLQPVLANPDTTITVLAPTNRAFQAALLKLKLTPAQLYADKTALANILSYHVLKDKAVIAGDLQDGQEYETVNNHKLKVVVDKIQGTFFVGGKEGEEQRAKVLAADLKGGKSIVHIIDTVLLPPPAPTTS